MQLRITRGGLFATLGILISIIASYAPQAAAQDDSAAHTEALTAKGAWSPTVLYRLDDVVTARGSTWRAKRGGRNKVPGQTQPSTAAYWEVLATGFNPSNAWVSTTKYQPNDLVTGNGSTWRAKRTNINRAPVPGPNWEQFAAKGDTGASGTQGPQGIQGPQGPAGPNTGVTIGSQSVPAISFDSDADTGIFSPADGKIAMVGNGTLFLHNLGSSNTALGVSALDSNTTGASNVAVGALALTVNTAGDFNTAIGHSALFANTTGFSNTAVGRLALESNTGGSGNTAVGVSALDSNTSGNDNTAVGQLALAANTTGDNNTAVGRSALFANTSGNDNIAVGRLALVTNFNGDTNTAIGLSALESNTSGSSNIAIGQDAGSNATSPDNSIFIGNDGASLDTATIKIGTQGTQTSAFIAGIHGATSSGGIAVLVNSSGQLGTATSSRRYKDDITAMGDVGSVLAKLRPVTFRYKQAAEGGSKPRQYGLIAEEVEEVARDLVAYNRDGSVETVRYHFLPPLLLAGWQAQQKTIAAQADEIAELKQRLSAIEARLPQTKAAALR